MATSKSKSVKKASHPAIRFSAPLLRPNPINPKSNSTGARPEAWSFLLLPKKSSALLPSRGPVSVRGTFNKTLFTATLQPDGNAGHWLKIESKLRNRASAEIGDTIALEITPLSPDEEPEPKLPPDFRKALNAASKDAQIAWKEITPVARRDWIMFMTSAKKAETRASRIAKSCDMLAKGKRRPCCFDRSGMYDKSLSCPVADGPALTQPNSDGSRRGNSGAPSPRKGVGGGFIRADFNRKPR